MYEFSISFNIPKISGTNRALGWQELTFGFIVWEQDTSPLRNWRFCQYEFSCQESQQICSRQIWLKHWEKSIFAFISHPVLQGSPSLVYPPSPPKHTLSLSLVLSLSSSLSHRCLLQLSQSERKRRGLWSQLDRACWKERDAFLKDLE